jgi:hypothetical protein
MRPYYETQRLVFQMTDPPTLPPRGWPRLVGLALFLVVWVLMSNVSAAVAKDRVDATPTTIAGLALSEVANGPLPTAIVPFHSLLQPKLGLVVFGAVTAYGWQLGARTLPTSRSRQPLRAAPGRRGRSQLHAYLN